MNDKSESVEDQLAAVRKQLRDEKEFRKMRRIPPSLEFGYQYPAPILTQLSFEEQKFITFLGTRLTQLSDLDAVYALYVGRDKMKIDSPELKEAADRVIHRELIGRINSAVQIEGITKKEMTDMLAKVRKFDLLDPEVKAIAERTLKGRLRGFHV